MSPRNEDTFADLNPEFFDSLVFPVNPSRWLMLLLLLLL
jgi:hypothetical protein